MISISAKVVRKAVHPLLAFLNQVHVQRFVFPRHSLSPPSISMTASGASLYRRGR